MELGLVGQELEQVKGVLHSQFQVIQGGEQLELELEDVELELELEDVAVELHIQFLV